MVIQGRKLDAGYKEALVVRQLDITVHPGEIMTIVGPNGSGKSTVLKTLTRLLPCCGGEVLYDARRLDEIPKKLLAQNIAVLSQQHYAPPDFSAEELVAFGRVPYQKWHEGLSARDKEVIRCVMEQTGVWHMRKKKLAACSGGEAQRVWIAMVLAQEPEILFLDEPTTYLDISYQLDLLRMINMLNKKTGLGVVMVLHDLAQALAVSHRIVVIKEGKKYAEGSPEEVITEKMMREVYHVECEILRLPKKKPILLYKDLLETEA